MNDLPELEITPDLKALTIHGPWAWAIMAGHKRMENRSWSTPHRGRIAIHAGRSKASDGRAAGIFQQLGIAYPEDFPRGVIVGTVDVTEILTQEEYLARYGKNPADQLMAFGPLCWVLKNPRPCRPIPCTGSLSLWNAAKYIQ